MLVKTYCGWKKGICVYALHSGSKFYKFNFSERLAGLKGPASFWGYRSPLGGTLNKSSMMNIVWMRLTFIWSSFIKLLIAAILASLKNIWILEESREKIINVALFSYDKLLIVWKMNNAEWTSRICFENSKPWTWLAFSWKGLW